MCSGLQVFRSKGVTVYIRRVVQFFDCTKVTGIGLLLYCTIVLFLQLYMYNDIMVYRGTGLQGDIFSFCVLVAHYFALHCTPHLPEQSCPVLPRWPPSVLR